MATGRRRVRFLRPRSMQIRPDDLTSPQVIELLQEHVLSMRAASPPESCYVLALDELRSPSGTFWGIWNGSDLAGQRARLDTW